ncbi:Fig1 domain-containing protein [Aspergillus candidus]|uniref:Ca2+ regulator and membrane fusion protein Fig1-domain-containing protein n=1 Tax=Aspergillus candidus TaxID=41067 RepID=A0A2I2FC02_ASPCN|nr:Ca2+ regulator and membrane fusion protein Fig1-domain-containing protein [Aspergillus candidus]PLB38155.1 Ca2+ regulator and membrane fusion protein Fig1-domain-containing protein [Aspergillus candidus]
MAIPRALFRYIPMIGYHHIIMVVCSIAIILLSIVLAGCTSTNGLSNVYLVSLKYRDINAPNPVDPAMVNPGIADKVYNVTQPRNAAITEIRAAYMGLCLIRSDGLRFCSNSAEALASLAKEIGNSTADPLNLIWIAKRFKDTMVFDGLIFIAIILTFICFVLLWTFPGWHEEVNAEGSEVEVKPFPSRPVSQAALGLIALGFMFGLISILWQHINSSAAGTMAEGLTYGAVESHVGIAAVVLGWAAVVCMGLSTFALLIMIWSIALIRVLTDDD